MWNTFYHVLWYWSYLNLCNKIKQYHNENHLWFQSCIQDEYAIDLTFFLKLKFASRSGSRKEAAGIVVPQPDSHMKTGGSIEKLRLKEEKLRRKEEKLTKKEEKIKKVEDKLKRRLDGEERPRKKERLDLPQFKSNMCV